MIDTIDDLFNLDSEFCAVNSFHDVIYLSTGVSDLTPEELRKIFESLPDYIQAVAFHWGLSDSLFRDLVFEYFDK